MNKYNVFSTNREGRTMSEENNVTKVRLTICGNQFVVKADESVHYIQKIAKMVDDRVRELEDSSSKINLQMATIIAALNYCDQFEKEKMITRELLKKTEDSETVAKEATDKLNQLIIENEQLKEEKNGLHKIIAELKNGTYQEISDETPSEKTETTEETEIDEPSDTTEKTQTIETSVQEPAVTDKRKTTTRKKKTKTISPK